LFVPLAVSAFAIRRARPITPVPAASQLAASIRQNWVETLMADSISEQLVGASRSDRIGAAIGAFRRDGSEWAVSRRETLVMAVTPIVVALVMALLVAFPRVFYWLSDEDHALEWLQFTLVALATGAFGVAAFKLWRGRSTLTAVLAAAVAVGAFFVAAEEVSWGQRVFGWGTPASFAEANYQDETNVHNFAGLHVYFVYGVALIGLYGALAPVFWHWVWSRRTRSPFTRLLVPPLFLFPSFALPFAYRTIRLAFEPEAYFARLSGLIVEYAETTEVCLYFGFCVFGVLYLRGLKASPRLHA
jgi:hypothetical protein